MRRFSLILALFGLWPLLAGLAPEPLPLDPPPPDLSSFLRLEFPSLEKPELALPELEPIVPPIGTRVFLPPPLAPDLGWKPQASLPQAGMLPCNPLGSVLGLPNQLLDCGRVRFSRGEYDDARRALEAAIRGSKDPLLTNEARYWLGESLLRLGRLDVAAENFRAVVKSDPKSEVGDYSLYSLGWIGLRLNEPQQALGHFEGLLKGRLASALIPHARHGRALALYGLGRFGEARQEWQSLTASRLLPPLRDDALFWLGEAVGRSGEPAGAVEILNRFTAAAPGSVRLESGIMRLGWWALEAGQPLEAVKSFRWLLSAFPRTQEMPWARYGLIRAFLALGDFALARQEALLLRQSFPSHSLVSVSLLDLGAAALARGAPTEAQSFFQELLSLGPSQSLREYVIFLIAESFLRQASLREAGVQYEVARALAATGAIFAHSGYRLGQVAFFQHDYGRAKAEGERLLAGALPDSLKAAALLLVGESSYRGRQYDAARSAYERFLAEFPQRPEAPLVSASLGWAELRQGRGAEARKRWDAFAADYPGHAEAPNALILAAELAWKEGSAAEARSFLDRLINQSPSSSQVEVALLNRALLLLKKGGHAEEASHGLRDLLVRAPIMRNPGRVHLAYGVALVNLRDGAGAESQFQAALREGDDPVARLGLGWASWLVGGWEVAHQSFTRARVERDPELRQLADYGLAVTYAKRGAYGEFKSAANAFLRTFPRHPSAPALVYLMTGAAIGVREWGEAGKLAFRLVTDYPESAPADDALFRVGEAAEQAGESRVSREAYQLLVGRFRQSPFFEESRLRLGLALARGGDQQAAMPLLSEFVAVNPKDPRLPDVLIQLGRSQESAGDRANARNFYGRLIQEFPQHAAAMEARVGQGRIFFQEGRWEEGRHMLEGALEASEGAAAAEAAFTLGEGYRKNGKLEEAVEAYMTAAYVAPDSTWGQRALLGAGESFQTLRRVDDAITVYRKLLSRPGADPDLARAARQALDKLGRSEPSAKR